MADPQRSNQSDDGQRHRVRELVESTGAMFTTRVVTPALLVALIGVVVWIGQSALSKQEEQRDDIAQIKSDLRDLNTRMTEGVIRQVNSNTERLNDHERRLQYLQGAVKTP